MDLDQGLFELEIPGGTTGKIWIPDNGRVIREIRINGQVIESQMEDGFVFAGELGPGKHRLDVAYEGARAERSSAQLEWPQDPPSEDVNTSGNWKGTYGSEGYVLFAAEDTPAGVKDLQNLPSYVEAIHLSKQDTIHWEAASSDARALIPEGASAGAIGAICTRDPLPTLQTMTVDINMKEAGSHQVALYFVDWDEQDRRLAVELFDQDTKELLAPVHVVRDFSRGKYLVYECKGPVRFRINHVRGPNATLSALFFDPAP
jgi:hypothetical protein